MTYKWPTTGIATLLPEPNLEYGKIMSESSDYFAIDLYFAEEKDFEDYVDKCKDKGFTVDYSLTSSHFSAKDANGNKGVAVAGCGSWGFGVTTHSRDAESAATVLKFFTGEVATELLYESIGTFPTNKNVLASSTDFQNGQLKELADILANCATPRPKLVNYPQLSAQYSNIIESIETLYGTSDYDLKGFIDNCVTQIDI